MTNEVFVSKVGGEVDREEHLEVPNISKEHLKDLAGPAAQAFVDDKLADANHIDVSDVLDVVEEAKEHLDDLESRYECPACISDDQYHAILQRCLEAFSFGVFRMLKRDRECLDHRGI